MLTKEMCPHLYCSVWSWRWWEFVGVRRAVWAVDVLLLPRPPPHSLGQSLWRSCDSSYGSIPAWARCPCCPWCPWQTPWLETSSHCRPAHTPARSVRSAPPHSAGGGRRTNGEGKIFIQLVDYIHYCYCSVVQALFSKHLYWSGSGCDQICVTLVINCDRRTSNQISQRNVVNVYLKRRALHCLVYNLPC